MEESEWESEKGSQYRTRETVLEVDASREANPNSGRAVSHGTIKLSFFDIPCVKSVR